MASGVLMRRRRGAVAVATAALALCAVVMAGLATATPVEMDIGTGEDIARVIWSAPPQQAFVLTNFLEGTLSLSYMKTHLLTFGSVNTSAVGVVKPEEQPLRFREVPQPLPVRQVPSELRGRQRQQGVGAESLQPVSFVQVEQHTKATEDPPAPPSSANKGSDGTTTSDLFTPGESRTYAHVSRLSIGGTLSAKQGSTIIGQIPQWSLYSLDDFDDDTPSGFEPEVRTTCGAKADRMLGGYCHSSDIEFTKTFISVPKHKYLRVHLSYSFIDNWEGEFGYVKVNDQIMWSQYHYACTKIFSENCAGVNVCGDTAHADKINQVVDFTMPHSGSEVKITIGSSLSKAACEASFAADDVKLYLL